MKLFYTEEEKYPLRRIVNYDVEDANTLIHDIPDDVVVAYQAALEAFELAEDRLEWEMWYPGKEYKLPSVRALESQEREKEFLERMKQFNLKATKIRREKLIGPVTARARKRAAVRRRRVLERIAFG